jgi:soluble lytic murein transglycosylase-like protein
MGLMAARLGQYPTTEIWDLARSAGATYNVDPALVMAVIQVESGFNPAAVNPSDPSYGLMQMLPATASLLAGRTVTGAELIANPALAVQLGAKYLAQNLAKYGSTGDAVAAYNAGTARKNAQGQYVNSWGDTKVDRYVASVMDAYLAFAGGSVAPVAGLPSDVGPLAVTATAAPGLFSNPWAWLAGAALAAVALVIVTD